MLASKMATETVQLLLKTLQDATTDLTAAINHDVLQVQLRSCWLRNMAILR